MPQNSRRSQGFTLIELLIVMAIIGILAAIAIPNYNEYVMRGRLMEAVTGLSDMRAKAEQYFQDNRTYDGALGACAASSTAVPGNANTKFFDFSCLGTATTYTITATGKAQALGFVYTVTQNNTRQTKINGTTGHDATTGWTGNATCWVLNKAGTC